MPTADLNWFTALPAATQVALIVAATVVVLGLFWLLAQDD